MTINPSSPFYPELDTSLLPGVSGQRYALQIGTVVSGTTAAATLTGNPPNQVLNLTLPAGALSALVGDVVPTTDNTSKLGSSSKRFANVYTEALTFADNTSQTTAANPLYCGSFENTTSLTNAGTTSSNLVTFDTTSTSNGISMVSSSQVTFAHTGRYLVNFLGQFQFSGGASNYNITVWWAKNGTIVPNSASTFTTTSAQASQSMANVEDIIQVTAGDYIQFYWWAGAAGISLVPTAAASSPTRPLSPSVKLNVFNVG